jgi:peptidoglycan/xylan/chitin deacetylase (PgdA/CDA1 family)
MRRFFGICCTAFLAALLASCASTPQGGAHTADNASVSIAPMAFAPIRPLPSDDIMAFPGQRRGLAGRTIRVSAIQDIVLARGEVVLTFDDGPVPGRTTAILDALERHNAKATFLMVGQMARNHPHLVREVASRGHTIGSHTQNHPNLAGMSFEAAMADIEAGERSIAAALVPTRHSASPFFRFPYLADTPALRRHLAARGSVVIDVDIDSKDYFQSTPAQVRERTLQMLERRGSGIVLFHDLHQRTANMLPSFLDQLQARGFRVVHLVPARSGPLLASAAPDT